MSAPRINCERWPGDCECGHLYELHQMYGTERCSACGCPDYHRTLFHWLLDKVGRS